MKANAMRLLTCVCLSIVAPLLAACTGCDDSENANDLTTTAQTTTSNKAATRVAVVEVLSRQYVETVDLPGASVHGFETTVLEAKVGGYVKQISQLANSVTGELEDVDIGSLARTGEVLAVLDAPEMVDDLAQTRALVLKAESEVAQAEAAIRQADAEVARDMALVDEARTERDEKDAFVRVRQADFDNQQSLHQKNATTRELVDKAKFQLDAAVAALASVDARIRTAEAMAHVADANREKAEADLTAAQAHVAVAQADMARTQTILDYAQIRAPFDGLITKRMVDHGAFVRPATSNSSAMPLFEITRTDRIRIEVKVPMSRAQRIRVGQPVIIHGIGGLPGFTAEGKITRSADALDQNSRMMNIQVHLSNPVKDAKYTRQQGTWTRSTSDTPRRRTEPVSPARNVCHRNDPLGPGTNLPWFPHPRSAWMKVAITT